jgi:hypothetical protein
LHGAVINIEVSAWCRCGFTVQNGFGVGNKSTARTELRNISMNSRNLARTSPAAPFGADHGVPAAEIDCVPRRRHQ